MKWLDYYMIVIGIISIGVLLALTSKINVLNYQLTQMQQLIEYRIKEVHKLRVEEACLCAPARLRVITDNFLKLKPITNTQYYKTGQ